jgi:hypothetical protein
VLLDFGAARRVIGDRSHALTAILKPHFAPIEQYADVAAMRQGPWTDLYGLASTVYYLLTGQPPLPAAARALHDELPPLARLQPSGCSMAFLQAVDWAMAVRPQERPQSVVLWRDVLEGRMAVPSLMRHDTTVPAVATRSPAPQPVADFDPTLPVSGRGTGALAPAALAALQPPTLPPHGPADAAPSHGFTSHRVPEAATDPSAAASTHLHAAARLWRRAVSHPGSGRRLRVAALAGGVSLLAAFAWVLPSPRAVGVATVSPAASVPSASGPASSAAAPPARPVEVETIETVLPPARGPAPGPAQAPAQSPLLSASAAMPPVAVAASAATPQPAPIVVLPAPPRERPREKDRERSRERQQASAQVSGPQERCGDRMFLTRLICMKHECDTDPRLRSHPECVRLHRAEQERRERMLER